MQQLVLASGSRYRAEQLSRLRIPFVAYPPRIDETPRTSEPPRALASRLAREKAMAPLQQSVLLTRQKPDTPSPPEVDMLVIGSDQVASLGDQLLGKPGNRRKAFEQLNALSEKTATFHTSLYLHKRSSNEHFCAVDTTTVTFRSLSTEEISRYLDADRPFDCAGSFKVESLGISLFESIQSQDPSALIGLPLIALCQGLREFGWNLP